MWCGNEFIFLDSEQNEECVGFTMKGVFFFLSTRHPAPVLKCSTVSESIADLWMVHQKGYFFLLSL